MNEQQMRDRTKAFGLRVIRLIGSIPSGKVGDTLGRQLLRWATSVGVNYRAAQRARSKAEFLAKLGIVEEESDESSYWIELLMESGLVKPARLSELLNESNEPTAIVVASIRTARRRKD